MASSVTSRAAFVDLTRAFSHLKIHLTLGTPQLSDKLLLQAPPDPQSLRACRRGPPLLPGRQCWNLSHYLLVSTCSAKENNYYGLGGTGQSILDLPALEGGPLAASGFSPAWARQADVRKHSALVCLCAEGSHVQMAVTSVIMRRHFRGNETPDVSLSTSGLHSLATCRFFWKAFVSVCCPGPYAHTAMVSTGDLCSFVL